MPPAQFGEVQTLVSLFTQTTIFLTVLGLVTVNIVANAKDETERNQIVFELEKLALYISLVGLVIVAIFSPFLQSFFKFESALPILATYLSIVIGVPLTFRSSFLRGQKDFAAVSWSGIVASFCKLLLSVLLVYIGFKTLGAIAGIVIAQLISLVYTGWRAKSLGLVRRSRFTPKLPNLASIKPELSYSLLVLIVSLTMTLLFSIDVVVVKHFFSPHTAGLYAGIATIARIIFYVAGPVSVVMLPFIKLDNHHTENRRFLLATLGIHVALAGIILIIFSIAPNLIIKLLIGPQYLPEASLLPLLSLTLFVISTVNVIYSYYMALRRYAVGFLAVIGAAVTAILLDLHHSNLTNIVEALLYSSILMLLLIPAWLLATRIKSQFSRS